MASDGRLGTVIDQFYSPKDAATQLGVSKATILRHIGDGELQAVDMRKKGSSRPLFRISESSIQALISDRSINKYVLPRSINRNLKPKRKHF